MNRFRKYIIATIVLVLLAMALAGCAKEVVETAPEATPAETPVEAPAEEPEEYVENCSVSSSDWLQLQQLAFIYDDATITLGDIVDDQKMEDMLGKANEIKSHTYTANDGKNMDQLLGMTEKEYHYEGLVIKTIDASENKEFFIFSIEITDPKYPTLRKIQVGDSYEKLRESYPEGSLLGDELTDAEDDYRYEPVDYVNVMNFHIKNKVVDSISINRLLD